MGFSWLIRSILSVFRVDCFLNSMPFGLNSLSRERYSPGPGF